MIWALLAGLVVGTLGTLIGAGGGFLLVPGLLFIFPALQSHEVIAVSLFCVAANATSGAWVYLKRGTVHLRSALLFAAAGIPGAWAGSLLTHSFDRAAFDLVFAGFMVMMGAYLIFKKHKRPPVPGQHDLTLTRRQYQWGALISFAVGFVASILGIGGGIIHVPLLTYALGFPVHLATGTSHFILAITAIVATTEHLLSGDLDLSQRYIWFLAAGVIVGAQIGARLSKRVRGDLILRLLGVAIILVAARIYYVHWLGM